MTDVVVALVVVAFVAAGVVGLAGRSSRVRAAEARVKCAANLRTIGQVILLYGCDNKGKFPRTNFAPGEALTQFTGARAKSPFFGDDAPKANDVTAAVFLIVRTQDVPPSLFVCPATAARGMEFAKGKSTLDYSNFTDPAELGYSFSNRYPDAKAMVAGYRQDSTVSREFVTAADLNPWRTGGRDVTPKNGPKDAAAPADVLRRANSANHGGDGQNVLYGDMRVAFVTTAFAGVNGDNIYTVSGSEDGTVTTSETVAGSPRWAGDSVLLPAAADAAR